MAAYFFYLRIQWQFCFDYLCKMNIKLQLKSLAKQLYLQSKLGDSTESYKMSFLITANWVNSYNDI